MKTQIITPFLVLFSLFCSAQITELNDSVVIGLRTTEGTFQLNEGASVLKYIDESLDEKRILFESIQIDSLIILDEKIYFLKLTTSSSNRTLVKWLIRKGDSLFIGNSQEQKFKSLSQYFMCEGEESCFPRLMNSDEGKIFWSCREDPSCVSPEYAKEHPCTCTKALIW